jgi:hypothetical protein
MKNCLYFVVVKFQELQGLRGGDGMYVAVFIDIFISLIVEHHFVELDVP